MVKPAAAVLHGRMTIQKPTQHKLKPANSIHSSFLTAWSHNFQVINWDESNYNGRPPLTQVLKSRASAFNISRQQRLISRSRDIRGCLASRLMGKNFRVKRSRWPQELDLGSHEGMTDNTYASSVLQSSPSTIFVDCSVGHAVFLLIAWIVMFHG